MGNLTREVADRFDQCRTECVKKLMLNPPPIRWRRFDHTHADSASWHNATDAATSNRSRRAQGSRLCPIHPPPSTPSSPKRWPTISRDGTSPGRRDAGRRRIRRGTTQRSCAGDWSMPDGCSTWIPAAARFWRTWPRCLRRAWPSSAIRPTSPWPRPGWSHSTSKS